MKLNHVILLVLMIHINVSCSDLKRCLLPTVNSKTVTRCLNYGQEGNVPTQDIDTKKNDSNNVSVELNTAAQKGDDKAVENILRNNPDLSAGDLRRAMLFAFGCGEYNGDISQPQRKHQSNVLGGANQPKVVTMIKEKLLARRGQV